MGSKIPFYLKYLKEEFDRRLETNPQYSMRSFAKWLDIDSSFLSKVFSRQKVLSLNFADQIINKLSSEDKGLRDKFIKSVSEEIACASLDKFDANLTDCDSE